MEDIEEKYEALSYKKGKRTASSSSSKYRGVRRNKRNKLKPWQAQIRIDRKKKKYLGSYATEEEAARAYDAEGARVRRVLNFPEEWENVEDIEAKYEALSYKKGKRTASSSFEDADIIGDGGGAPPSSSNTWKGAMLTRQWREMPKGLQPKEAPKRRKRIRTCKL